MPFRSQDLQHTIVICCIRIVKGSIINVLLDHDPDEIVGHSNLHLYTRDTDLTSSH